MRAVYIFFPMHTLSETMGMRTGWFREPRTRCRGGRNRYTGRELLRILARHPFVSVVAGGLARRRRASSRRWLASSPAASCRSTPTSSPGKPTSSFRAARYGSRGARCLLFADAGVKVIDLSGAFRLNDDACGRGGIRKRMRLPAGVTYGTH